jgi:CHAT domain-containing protein/tetratricopeptide (TPR) repeat protein
VIIQPAVAQKKSTIVAELQILLEKKEYAVAAKIAEERISALLKTGTPDTIAAYIPYLGTITTHLKGADKAKAELTAIIKRTRSVFPFNSELVAVYFAAADFLSREGNDEEAYALLGELKNYFEAKEPSIAASLHRIESNQGSYAMRFGNYGLASRHYRESLRLIQQLKEPDMGEVFITNNSMGIVMWYSSKLDSCLIFFEKGIEALNKMDSTVANRNFRVALVQNNIGNVYDELGRKEEAIISFDKAIRNYKLFIASPGLDDRKKNALINQFQAVDNLAKTYQELGDYSKAHNLLYYSYQEKLKNFGGQSPEVYKSLIQLGSQYYFQKDYTKASSHLLQGLDLLKKNSSQKKIWEAEGYSYLASISAARGNTSEAKRFYEEADFVYKAILDEGYSSEYLQYLADVSLFYAKNKEATKAVSLAKKGLNYATTQGKHSLLTFYHLLNLAGVYLETNNYEQAIAYSKSGLDVLDKLISKSDRLLDSLSFEMEKPAVVLVKSKASYAQLREKNENSLTEILKEVMAATAIIERKKATLSEEKDVAYLMANYKELLDFTKKLQLELYELSGDHAYLDQIINLQESAIYNRIRSRLDKQKALQFTDVPAVVLQKEESLKAAIHLSLQAKRSGGGNIQAYLDAQKNWNEFQAALRSQYPQYYAMRYAEKRGQSIKAISAAITPGITVVRYIFIGEKLFALVIDGNSQEWVSLPANNGLEKLIIALADSDEQHAISAGISYALYQQLWQPLEKKITGTRVTIIPDGILHYLSFDMLTVQKPASLSHWIKYSLVNRYAISYHYSLLAIEPVKEKKDNSGFAAFAPGFSDNVKSSYRAATKDDTLAIDNEYLTLIPLPFSIDLSKKMQSELGGDIFIGNSSTNNAFITKAGHHAIIQLSTHAEANNQYPEYSRLIFAKNLSNVNESNSLYLYDIYNCDMTSQLAVLTACETGRPGFFDGEGMISMAHAFHYAGSESMLTGLWKIDEQSSTIITGIFYKNLAKGMTKDEALQQAKLQYLQTAQGRMLSPKYWAGLIIMGDLSPVKLQSKKSYVFYWILGAVLILFSGWRFFRKRTGGDRQD